MRRGLAKKIGDRRGASYRLAEGIAERKRGFDAPSVDDTSFSLTSRQQRILEIVAENGEVTSHGITEQVDVGYGSVISDVNRLIAGAL